ncbi:FHA domain-containing protein [Schaalia sp. 19OD2882]|uniref:FHA domain-containing protein FhaB/FipA n=1 Tax=Schaalia sp. 19OD2882 TaxID=2794089 RepID=UPI001C1EE65E|nr:FHA domain-containing protein [Schaalia sp. 19OD2882]QWW20549.1 FHA domain-containing protein [Schaalia sp. 19OD2882]
MMTDLTFTILRIGFLVLLWLLVLWAVHTLRLDIFGTVVTPRGKGRREADRRRKDSRRKRPDPSAVDSGPTSLLITGGPLVGTVMNLGATPIVVGRSPACNLVLEDEYSSAHHARLAPDGQGNWWIEDLGSRNGTSVDDELLESPRELRVGDIVRIGQTTMELVR